MCLLFLCLSDEDLEVPAPKLPSGEWLVAGSFDSETGMHTPSAYQNSASMWPHAISFSICAH